MSLSQTAKFEIELTKRLCRELNSPRSLTVSMLLEAGEYDQVLNLEIDDRNYVDIRSFSDDYLITSVLSKSKNLPSSFDRKGSALKKWREAEALCYSTNQRLQAFAAGKVTPTLPGVQSVVYMAIEIAHKALGSLDSDILDLISREMDFGPGATTSCRGLVTRGRKFSNHELTTTTSLLDFGLFCLPDLWKRNVKSFRLQDWNELEFVPKNAKTDRAITIENDLNIFVQKGIGMGLRKRLRRLGVVLETQADRNRELVSKAYADDLATIDLSAASDTISYELVKMFLPHDWFDLLSFARPEKTSYQGEIIDIEKFSGMGNGFTFELETLIFKSILLAVKRFHKNTGPVAAFGDDLICENSLVETLTATLNFLGFNVNSGKSFGKRSFHESCGVDYFQTVNVRPFYFRVDDESLDVSTAFLYINHIRRYACHRNGGWSCDVRFLPAWLYGLGKVPRSRLFYVPSWDYSDGGIVENFDKAAPSFSSGAGRRCHGYHFRYLRKRSVETQRFSDGAYIGALRKMTSFSQGREALRGRFRHPIVQNGVVPFWGDLGPWL